MEQTITILDRKAKDSSAGGLSDLSIRDFTLRGLSQKPETPLGGTVSYTPSPNIQPPSPSPLPALYRY